MSEATVRCPKCGHKGIMVTNLLNSDLRLIADSQAAEIERLRSEVDECLQLLSIAEDAWDCGAWNSLIAMQQLYLTRDWYEAARKVTNEYDDVH